MNDQGKPFLVQIAHALNRVRQKVGFSYRELGEYVGMDGPNVFSLLNGKRHTTIKTLDKLAAAMGVRIVVDFKLEPINAPRAQTTTANAAPKPQGAAGTQTQAPSRPTDAPDA